MMGGTLSRVGWVGLSLVLICHSRGPFSSPPVLHAQERPIPLDTLLVQAGSRVSPHLPILTRSVQVIRRAEISALPARTVSEVLEWATGVEVMARSPAQSDLSIRGAGFEQVVVLVDGVRMSDPQTGHFDLDLTVPLDQIERVEILRGPASAMYGADAMGGVVNVVTRGGESPWQGRLEGGSWGSAGVSGSGAVSGPGRSSVRGGGEFSRSDGHRPGTDFETLLLNLGLIQPAGSGRLTGQLGLSRKDFGARDFYAPYPSFEKTRTYTSSLRWHSSGGEGSGLEAGVSFRRHEDEFVLLRDDPAYYRNQHTSSQGGGEVLARYSPASGVDLALGGELFGDVLTSNSLGDRTEGRGAAFGEAVFGRGTPMVASLGLREDWHQRFGSFLSPSLSGSYAVGRGLRFRAAMGRSFRSPTFTERFYRDPINQGREDLSPERAWSGEFGADFFEWRPVRVSATVFLRRSEDLIDWARDLDAGDDVPWETRNVEEATFRGVEVDLDMQGPMGTTVAVGGAFLSVESEETRGFRSKYALRPLKERITGTVQRRFGQVLTVSVHAQRNRRAGENPYHRVGVRAGLRSGSLRIYLDGTNLINEAYPDITGANAPGRALRLGVEVAGGS